MGQLTINVFFFYQLDINNKINFITGCAVPSKKPSIYCICTQCDVGGTLSQLSDSGQTLSEDSGVDIAESGRVSKDSSPRPARTRTQRDGRETSAKPVRPRKRGGEEKYVRVKTNANDKGMILKVMFGCKWERGLSVAWNKSVFCPSLWLRVLDVITLNFHFSSFSRGTYTHFSVHPLLTRPIHLIFSCLKNQSHSAEPRHICLPGGRLLARCLSAFLYAQAVPLILPNGLKVLSEDITVSQRNGLLLGGCSCLARLTCYIVLSIIFVYWCFSSFEKIKGPLEIWVESYKVNVDTILKGLHIWAQFEHIWQFWEEDCMTFLWFSHEKYQSDRHCKQNIIILYLIAFKEKQLY